MMTDPVREALDDLCCTLARVKRKPWKEEDAGEYGRVLVTLRRTEYFDQPTFLAWAKLPHRPLSEVRTRLIEAQDYLSIRSTRTTAPGTAPWNGPGTAPGTGPGDDSQWKKRDPPRVRAAADRLRKFLKNNPRLLKGKKSKREVYDRMVAEGVESPDKCPTWHRYITDAIASGYLSEFQPNCPGFLPRRPTS